MLKNSTSSLESKQLFSLTSIGLKRVYQTLYAQNSTEITKDNLQNTDDISTSDLSFVHLINQNFKKIDTDESGAISSDELKKFAANIQTKGLTQNQLYALYTQSGVGVSKTLLETVLSNFTEIDKNKDGKVSEAEINAYQENQAIAEKKQDIELIKASDLTIFYDSDSSDESSNETSILG